MTQKKLEKNILDLNYTKNLQYYNTSILILFTYFIGVSIALLTEQINYNNITHLSLIAVISLAIVAFIILLMLKFKNNMINIIQEIKKL